LECDEIKRLDPPYNIHLRAIERSTWFASRDLRSLSHTPDATHVRGPLPSRFAVAPLAALIELCEGAAPSAATCAMSLAVPPAFLPSDGLFREGFLAFSNQHLANGPGRARQRVDRAARRLWLLRGRNEPEAASEEAPPDAWDLARVLRRLERNLVQAGLILRRARYLALLAHADVLYREGKMTRGRALILGDGIVRERHELAHEFGFSQIPVRRTPALEARKAALDIAAYDRLRVLATELKRVVDEGGEVAVRIAQHTFSGDRFVRLTREV
jgi:hypothetical protein